MIPSEVLVCVRTRCLEAVESCLMCIIELSQLIPRPAIICLHYLDNIIVGGRPHESRLMSIQ